MVLRTKTNHQYILDFCTKYGYSINESEKNFTKAEGEGRFNVCIYYKGISPTSKFRDNLWEYFRGQAVSNGGVLNTYGRIIVENQVRKINRKTLV